MRIFSLACAQCHLSDGSVFQPIGDLLKKRGKDVHAIRPQQDESPTHQGKPPPHALLPEDEAEELPVSNASEGYVSVSAPLHWVVITMNKS